MNANSSTIYMRIEIDDKGSPVVKNLGNTIGDLSGKARTVGQDLDSLGSRGSKAALDINSAFKIFGATLGGISLAMLGREIFEIADRYTLLESRLKLVTDGEKNLAETERQLYEISLRTHQGMSGTIELYSTLARSTSQLGMSQKATMQITESINKTLLISGGSAESAHAAIIQLNQGMASGVLRGEEFNSVMEQTPRLAQAIADGLEVDIGQLRTMAGEGKLTSDVVTKALLSQKETIDKEYAKMSLTIGQSWQDLKTVIEGVIHEADKGAGGVASISTSIEEVARTIEQNRAGILSLFTGVFTAAAETVKIIANLTQGIQGLAIVAASKDKNLTDLLFGPPGTVKQWQIEIENGSAFLKDQLKEIERIKKQAQLSYDIADESEKTRMAVQIKALDEKSAKIKEAITLAEQTKTINKEASDEEQASNVKHISVINDKIVKTKEDQAEQQRALTEAQRQADEKKKLTEELSDYVATAGKSTTEKELYELDKRVEGLRAKYSTEQSMLDLIAQYYDKKRAEISKTESDSFAKANDKVTELLISMDALSGRDKSLSAIEQETARITTGFAKWNVHAEAVYRTLSQSTDPEIQQLAARLKEVIDKAPALSKATQDAFDKKQIKDFEIELRKVNLEYENMSEYQKTLTSIHEKFQDLRDDAKRRFGDTQQYYIELEKVNAAEQLSIKNNYQLAVSSNSFWDGFAAEAKKAQREMETLGKVGAQVFDKFENTIEGSLVKVFRGEFDSIDDLWKTLMKDMLQIFLEYLAKKITMALIESFSNSSIGQGFSSLLSGIGLGGNGGSTGGTTNYSGLISGATSLYSAYNGNNGGYVYTGADSLTDGLNTNTSYTGSTGYTYSADLSGNYSDNGAWADVGKDAGTTLAGQAAKSYLSGSGSSTGSSALSTAGGYLGMAGGAYGIYNGISNMSNGNVGAGAVQTGIGAYSMYNGAVSAGLVQPGTATAAYNAAADYVGSLFASSPVVETAPVVVETAPVVAETGAAVEGGAVAAEGGSTVAGASMGAAMETGGTVASVLTVLYVLSDLLWDIGPEAATTALTNTMNAIPLLTNNLNQFDAGLMSSTGKIHDSTAEVGGFSSAIFDISGSMLDGAGALGTYTSAMYDAQTGTLALSNGAGLLAYTFDETTQKWSLSAGSMAQIVDGATLDVVAAARDYAASLSGVNLSMVDAVGVANMAAAAYGSLSENGQSAAGDVGALASHLEDLGMSSEDASDAAAGLVGQIEAVQTPIDQLNEVMTNAGVSAATLKDGIAYMDDGFGGLGDAIGYTSKQFNAMISQLASYSAYSGGEAGNKYGGLLGANYAAGGVTGGVFSNGSWLYDDLYIGTINGVRQYAMGGEYIMPQRQTAKYYNTLELMRADRYADGGVIASMSPTLYADGAQSSSASQIASEIQQLRADLRIIGNQLHVNTKKTSDMLERFDLMGMPEVRS